MIDLGVGRIESIMAYSTLKLITIIYPKAFQHGGKQKISKMIVFWPYQFMDNFVSDFWLCCLVYCSIVFNSNCLPQVHSLYWTITANSLKQIFLAGTLSRFSDKCLQEVTDNNSLYKETRRNQQWK